LNALASVGGTADGAAADLDRTLAALADPHRRLVVELLRDRAMRAGELAQAVGLSPPALSRHLRTLKAGGLIEEAHPDFDARVRVYTLRPQPMADLKAWLETTERLWTDQLLVLKAHVESRP
jgi:DNA-binding transcriptional ArsR family regulator